MSSSAGQAKRTAQTAGFVNEKRQRAVKRRASKACQTCRLRKVRCNVVEAGPPCTNCRLDEVECIVNESRRKRRILPKPLDTVPSTTSSARPAPAGSGTSTAGATASATASSTSTVRSNNVLDGLYDLSRIPSSGVNKRDGHVPHDIYRKNSDASPVARKWARHSVQHGATASNPMSPTKQSFSGKALPMKSKHGLPDFIKPLPDRLEDDDIEYLNRKKALSLPEGPLQSEIIRCYFDYIHPYMPILDMRSFLEALNAGPDMPDSNKISILVFQAVMFAGSAFVDMSHLRNGGFSKRRDARRTLHQRTRILYDIDVEEERLPVLQAVLLITSSCEALEDNKDTWHWIGIAVSTAFAMGLNRNTVRYNMDDRRRRHWRRLWWSCSVRDRFCSLATRRPCRIKLEDCDVPMLTMDDFEFEAVEFDGWPEASVAKNVGLQRRLAALYIELIKVTECTSLVLQDQATLFDDPSSRDNHTEEKHNALLAWKMGLPIEAEVTKSSDLLVGEQATIALHVGLLHMVYYATLAALHRPRILLTQNGQYEQDDTSKNSPRAIVRAAAFETSEIAGWLFDHDLVRFLPVTATVVIQPAIIGHLLDLETADADSKRRSLSGLHACTKVMNRLRDCYGAADLSLSLVEMALRRAEINGILNLTDAPSTQHDFNPDNSMVIGIHQDLVTVSTALQGQTHGQWITPPPDGSTGTPPALGVGAGGAAPEPQQQHQQQQQQQQQQPMDNLSGMVASPSQMLHQMSIEATNNTFATLTPPGSNSTDTPSYFDHDVEFFLNLQDQLDSGETARTGESAGFLLDLDCMHLFTTNPNSKVVTPAPVDDDASRQLRL